VSNPVDFSATPVVYDRAPPRLGEHTEEVLRDWLGYSEKAIDLLRSKVAI
jgi:crotonobetainyl-CoA:carnitine CoA-transferase CaiB-like acyl-CoA transferase